jgi:hypothetical protein
MTEHKPLASCIDRDGGPSNDLVSDEIEEFLEEMADCKPASAVAWLREYLPSVKTIHAFQLLSGTDEKNGWDILGKVKNSIFTQVGGVLQAEPVRERRNGRRRPLDRRLIALLNG